MGYSDSNSNPELIQEPLSHLEIYNLLMAGAQLQITFANREAANRYVAALRVVKSRQDKFASALDIEPIPLQVMHHTAPSVEGSAATITLCMKKRIPDYGILCTTILPQ